MAGSISLRKGFRDIKTIAYLTLDTLFWSKKTLFVLLLSLIVLGLAVVGRVVLTLNLVPTALPSSQVFGTLMATAVIRFLVIFVTLFYGTALISEEVEGKTLTYLFMRPIPKPTIMLGKFLALIWIGAIMVLPTVLLSYLILYLRSDMLPFFQDLHVLVRDIGIILLALLAYGSLFSLLGAWLKHSILVGLAYAFGWEGILALLPGFTRKLTITHYIQSIFPHEDTLGAISMLIGQRTDPVEAIVTLVLLTSLFLATASLMVREKEYVLEQ
ncbi:MAG: ABC transporter permease subunit [Acidobacteriia bacterium]|nr:ABC transporter permease subunit [Terriglobia bacterium]